MRRKRSERGIQAGAGSDVRRRRDRSDGEDIERLCLKLLLQQQPVAKDLRRISRGAQDDHGYGAYRGSDVGYCGRSYFPPTDIPRMNS